MFIGHLHNWQQQNSWNTYNSILIRFGFDEWKYGHIHGTDWKKYIYGQHSKRAKLRELIYPNLTYYDWFNLMQHYSLIFLSINFDIYPSQSEFIEFTKDIVKTFKKKYPNKDFILGAGNETQEKRGSAEKVMETAIDVYYGARNAGILEPKICIYNQKIKTQAEQKCVKQILDDDFIQHYVNYFGYQSLETSPTKLKEYIPLIKQKGFEPVDVELGTKTSDFKTIKELFNDGLVDKVFILTPYISQELANYDENFKNYGLSINGNKKDKYQLISYIQKYKTSEEDMKIADEYKFGDKNDKVIDWIQAQLFYEGHLAHPIDFGNFNIATEKAVKAWQKANVLAITGVITKYHISVLVERSKNPNKTFRQLMIYAS